MANLILKVISLLSNSLIVKKSCLKAEIDYKESVFKYDNEYDVFDLKIKNIGSCDIDNIKFNGHGCNCNSLIPPFSIPAGESKTQSISFIKGKICPKKGAYSTYERVSYRVILPMSEKRKNGVKYCYQDLYVGCSIDKSSPTADFGKEHVEIKEESDT